MKKILLILGVLLLLLISCAIAVPYFYKDEIVTAVKDTANENLNATLEFSEVNLSLFRDFPNLSLGLENLKVSGKDQFEGIDLISAKDFDISLDFWSVYNGGNPLKINGLKVEDPNINVFILKDGKANFDITKNSETGNSDSSSDFLINLDNYKIENGNIHYEDRTMDFLFKMEGVNHEGAGNLSADIFDLNTNTTAKSVTAGMDGITYLNEVKASLDAMINMDLKKMKFTLKENDLNINALKLLADGWLKLNETNMEMDFKFKAPTGSFKEFLSLIPGAYTKGYENVKASGKFAFNADVKGIFDSENEILPAFNLKLDLDKGDFKYPDLPLGVSNISVDLNIKSPSGNVDRMTVNVPKFSMKIGNNPVEGHFNLKTPVSNPEIDMKLKGKLDLDQLSKAMPMEDVEKISGLVDADVKMKAKMSELDKGDYENVDASGYFNVVNMQYRAKEMPPVSIKKMNARLTPKNLTFNDLDMKAGKSDFKGNGEIDNLLAYFSEDKTLTGDIYLRSGLIDANEWLTEEESPSPDDPAESTEVFDRFDFKLNGQADLIKYEDHKMLNTVAKGRMTSNHLKFDQFSTKVGKSDIKAKGEVKNAFDYLFKNETLSGVIILEGMLLDLNELMGAESESSSTEEPLSEPILVPEKIDMKINAKIDRVLYDDMDLKDLNGAVMVKDEAVSMNKVKMKGLGGSMLFDGKYSSKNTEEPKFSFAYDLSSLDFKQAFKTFNSFEKLAPIGKFISGNFTSKLKIDGTLGKDLTPNLNSLNAEGFLETLNGLISGFEPLDKVSNLLNIKDLKSTNLNEVKTWFDIKDGTVEVREFPANIGGIPMKIGGKHGLEKDMDYNIKAKIPRKLLKKAGVSNAANKGLDLISKEAKKLGVNLADGEFINVLINMTGSMTAPKTSLKLLGTEGDGLNAKTIVNEAKEEVKEQVEQKADEIKKDVKEKVDDEKEKLKAKADAEIAKVMKRAKQKADLLKKEGYSVADKAKDEGYRQADKLIKAAGNNPLKKAGAKVAADRLKKETDKKVTAMKRETDKKAADILTAAEKQSDKIRKKYE